MTTTTNWTDLIVTDSDGEQWGSLGGIVENAPANLDNATIESGQIDSWDGFFLSAEGEEADADTPRAIVNWDGFADKINQARS